MPSFAEPQFSLSNPFTLHTNTASLRRRRQMSQRCLGGLIVSLLMVLSFFKNKGTSSASAMSTSTATTGNSLSKEARLRNALWGYFAGDALAMPTHWYYGGFPQIQRDYGVQGITGYTKPVTNLSGSILNKSNTNGGGRGSFSKTGTSIIGDVINHGKRPYWDPSKQIHYHATLQKGENTLEVQLARVLMKSIVQNGGAFNAQHFREAYIAFMTKPGSHNDTYASTCHRMFFANLVLKKLPPEQCPDNDMHNVDTVDGLVLPTITSLAMAAQGAPEEDIANAAAATAAVTRRSAVLEGASRVWSTLVARSLSSSPSPSLERSLNDCAKSLGMRQLPSKGRTDQMTACYLDSALPSTLDMVAKYSETSVWEGLLANANVGGENVHRGSILGAVLGAHSASVVEEQLQAGLFHQDELKQEIDAFVSAVLKN